MFEKEEEGGGRRREEGGRRGEEEEWEVPQQKQKPHNTMWGTIFECEFLAVLIAYKAWAKEVAGSQLVVFIDNNAARYCLISCDTSNEIASVILREILEIGR